jgi:hypothetical protein
VRVLPGRACHSALRCRGRHQPRPRLSTRYRLDQPWGSHRGLARVPMPGIVGGGPVMRRNPSGSHGRPPSGPPGTEGTVLVCPCAAGRRGLPDGGSTRFHGGSTRRHGHLGRCARLRLRCGNCRAAAGGCHRASPMIKHREAAAAVGPGPAAPFRLTVLVVSAVHMPGPVRRAGAAASSRLRIAGPAGPFVLALSGDRSPIGGCTTTSGDRVPSDTVIPHILPFAGMVDRHPRAGCRQRRAIGVPSFLLLFDQGFRGWSSLLLW